MSKRSGIITSTVLVILIGVAVGLQMRSSSGGKKNGITEITKPEVDKPTLPRSASTVAVDKSASRKDRLQAISELSDELSIDEARELRELVNTPDEDPTVRNDAFVKLQEQKLHPQKGLIYGLIENWEDEEESAIWRDFAIQFLAGAYEDAAPEEKQLAISTLFKAAQDDACPQAATALLTLQRISALDPTIRTRLATLNQSRLVATSDATLRAAAINVAIDSQDESILPGCRKMASDSGAQSRERLSSIGALGQLGDSSDLARLEKLTEDGDPRVRRVANYQLRALKKRLKL